MTVRNLVVVGASAGLLFILAGCDNGPSAVQTRERADAAPASLDSRPSGRAAAEDATRPARRSRGYDSPAESSDLGDGLVWAANRKHSAEDNAHYQFEHHGSEFGTKDLKAFVAKADAFAAHPPEGVLKLERSNGDTVMYDPKANIFAVATKDGAPRTMFKPTNGQAYWDEQKAKESERAGGGSDRS
jgi:pyocin large subunit-like protein